jgi:hypothetical protein
MIGDEHMNEAKIALNAFKYVKEFLKLLRNLHGEGVLLPTAPEWVKKQFFDFLDGVGGSCEHVIAILEGEIGGAGGKPSGPKNLH